MAVFKYSGERNSGERTHETGTIVAQDRLDAYDKLRSAGLTNVHLKKVEGLAAFIQQLRIGR